MEDIKKVVSMILQEFQEAEVGNKVTENNMMGLNVKIMMALDGKIKLAKSSPEKSKEE